MNVKLKKIFPQDFDEMGIVESDIRNCYYEGRVCEVIARRLIGQDEFELFLPLSSEELFNRRWIKDKYVEYL